MGPVDLSSIRKVAVFLPPTLGDCVNHLATLRWLSDGLPGREILAVSDGLGLDVLTAFPQSGWQVIGRRALWLELVRRGRYDLGLFPYVQNKLVRVAQLAGVRYLAGARGGKHDEWFSASVDKVQGEHQVLDLCRRLFGELGVTCGDPVWDLGLEGPVAQPGQVAIMTGASRPDKRWPLEKFRFVASELKKRGCTVVNVGGPSELGALSGISDRDAIGGTELRPSSVSGMRTTAEVLQQTKVLLTNDTGLMHLAGAAGTPVIALYMAESPEEYFPPGSGHYLFKGDAEAEDVLNAVLTVLEQA